MTNAQYTNIVNQTITSPPLIGIPVQFNISDAGDVEMVYGEDLTTYPFTPGR